MRLRDWKLVCDLAGAAGIEPATFGFGDRQIQACIALSRFETGSSKTGKVHLNSHRLLSALLSK